MQKRKSYCNGDTITTTSTLNQQTYVLLKYATLYKRSIDKKKTFRNANVEYPSKTSTILDEDVFLYLFL